MENNRARLSACIITYNEADRIEACLRSVGFCDEIVVVDSHSTDATRELASALGARVIERDWPGYRTQKQFAVDAASSDWVLCLDADERVSAELRAEIEAARERGFALACRLVRAANHRLLRPLPAPRQRLSRPSDPAVRPPSRRVGSAMRSTRTRRWTAASDRLRGHLEHFSYRSLCDHHSRMQRYAALMAQALYDSGKRCGLGKVLVNPQWRFVRGYLLRLGFLDGWRGLVFALIEANYVRRKYLQLYMLARMAAKPACSANWPADSAIGL